MFRSRFAFALIVCLVATPCHSAITLSVDLDSTMPGIQSSVLAMPGDQLVVDVVLELTGVTTLSNYSVSLAYDPSELTFDSGTETPPVPLDSFVPISDLGGEIDGIEAVALIGNTAAPFNQSISRLVFDVSAPAGDASDIDFTLFVDGIFDGFFDANALSLTPTFRNASVEVSAVPEPSSFGLFAVAAVGLMTRRRRRS